MIPAYTSLSSADLELWTMNLGGSHNEQLTDSFGYGGNGTNLRQPTNFGSFTSLPELSFRGANQ